MLQHQNPFVVSFSVLFLAFFYHCSAMNFIAGDSSGWIIPPYPTYYSNWSHKHFMKEGDSLEFNFDTKYYNLIQISQYEYDHCTAIEPLKVFNSSPAVIPLNKSGVYFFICSISNYCCLGQKIAISVHERSPGNPPSPSPSPSQVPISPPNGSAPQPHGTTNTTSPPPPASNTHEEKSNAVTFLRGGSFSVFLGRLLSMFGTFLGFWMM